MREAVRRLPPGSLKRRVRVMMKVGHVNVGCRINACETEWLASEEASHCGGEVVDSTEQADVVFLGTCCVTARSRSKSRKAARRLLTGTSARVVLTGCASRLFPEDYDGGSRIGTRYCGDRSISTPCDSFRSRGLLKIQDGCSNNCAYCIVPKARGASRSFSRESILMEARRMAAAGMREIVLTGVDLSSYGRDLDGSYGLADLAGDLLATGGFRIRLGSVEPMGLDGGVLGRLAVPGMCRHLHFAFQSGSTAVLSRMGRPYGGDDVRRLVTEARRLFPGGIIGSDIMAGFPGETESDFEASLGLLEAGLLDYAHVFPYSPRPGTASYARYGAASTDAGERVRMLRAASETNRRSFEHAQAGLELRALVEGRRIRNRHVALTDNYVALSAPPGSKPGEMIVMRPSLTEILNCRSDPEPE